MRPESAPRLDWLDPLRGLAIAGVVLYHIALILYGIPPFDHVKETWLPLAERLAQTAPVVMDSPVATLVTNVLRYSGWLGYQGVGLFLVLSGFGLAWSSAHAGPRGALAPAVFFRRRVMRIFPPYWAGHLFFLAMSALVGQPQISLTDGRFYLSLAGARFLPDMIYYIAPAWWYVGLILQLYLLYPLLWMWLRRSGLAHFWIGSGAITLLVRSVMLLALDRDLEMWSMGAVCLTRLFEFTFGMGLAYWLAQRPAGLDQLLRRPWALPAALALYGLGLACSFTRLGQVVAHMLIAVGVFPLVYAVARFGVARLPALGQGSAWLGRQAYPLMILHQPILWWFIPVGMARWPEFELFLAILAVVTALVVALSALFGAAVERFTGWVTRRLATR